MNRPVVSTIRFTITFPEGLSHLSRVKLNSLAKRQLTDFDTIETINHLFGCQRCFENYRHVRNFHTRDWARFAQD